ncbi:hypothetical protein BsWGS_18856 [Bradybaena similaris]
MVNTYSTNTSCDVHLPLKLGHAAIFHHSNRHSAIFYHSNRDILSSYITQTGTFCHLPSLKQGHSSCLQKSAHFSADGRKFKIFKRINVIIWAIRNLRNVMDRFRETAKRIDKNVLMQW